MGTPANGWVCVRDIYPTYRLVFIWLETIWNSCHSAPSLTSYFPFLPSFKREREPTHMGPILNASGALGFRIQAK